MCFALRRNVSEVVAPLAGSAGRNCIPDMISLPASVAPLAGSAGRNMRVIGQRQVVRVVAPLAGSAGRNPLMICTPLESTVAPLAGSAGRNRGHGRIVHVKYVAPLAGSAGRNAQAVHAVYNTPSSLPSRGARVEIGFENVSVAPTWSLPSRGARVEIRRARVAFVPFIVAPLAGSAGRNGDFQPPISVVSGRSPRGERG